MAKYGERSRNLAKEKDKVERNLDFVTKTAVLRRIHFRKKQKNPRKAVDETKEIS